jgi:cytochrome c5
VKINFIFKELTMNDSQFVKAFTGMMLGLIGLTIVLFIIANMIGGKTKTSAVNDDTQVVAERIKPVGTLVVAAKTVADAVIPAAQAADAAKGKATYDASCAACHGTGVAGAPKLGDKAAWADRIAQGEDVLNEHAIKGFQGKKGVMPAKGGNMSLSDDVVKDAVAYMVEQSK